FAYRRDVNIAVDSASTPVRRLLRDVFDTPDLGAMDDAIVNGTLRRAPGQPAPLALFRAARVDYSLQRLHHYTGTDPEHFQNFVIFTNYQFYVDAFASICRERVAAKDGEWQSFVEPGNVITLAGREQPSAGAPPDRMPHMPAFHLVRARRDGITMINIGT